MDWKSYKKRILIMSPGIGLFLLGNVVFDLKILGFIGIGYILVVEYSLRKKNKAPLDPPGDIK